MTIAMWEDNNTPDERRPDTDSWVPMLPAVADLASKICSTEFVPASLRNSAPKTAAAILYGRELGLPPMTALGSVHVIQGRAGLYSETMRAMIQAAGHELRVVEMTETRCVIKGRRRGEDEWVTAAYAMTEAVKSGDAKKNPNYTARPAEMLLARASGRLAKMHFADVIKGLGAVEELSTMDPAVEVEVVQAPARVEAVETQERPAAVGRRRPAPSKPTDTGQAPVAPAVQSAPVERQRMARPAPRSQPAPPAPAPSIPVENHATAAQVDTLPDDEPEDVVDADVVDETTGEVSTPPEEDPRRKITTYVLLQWKRLHVEDRAERLYLTGELVGHPVTSTTDLTVEELRGLADTLGRSRDLKALQAVIDQRLIDAEADRG